MMNPSVYLDYAAATPLDQSVLSAMQPYFSDLFYNPSADYRPARSVHQELDASRSRIAYWLGAQANEIIFTAGGTEANNLAIHGIMRAYPGANILISAIEHESVRNPAHNYDCREIAVDRDGRLDMDKMISLIDENTVLISVMYANNEIGTIQALRQISQKLEAIRKQRKSQGHHLPLLLHSDACQAANYLDLHASRLGVDLMTLNGGKIYGPKQSGALYVNRNVRLAPLIEGGGQERNLRSGTENVAADVGLATALDIAQRDREQETIKLQQLSMHFIELLKPEIPSVEINGSLKYRLANNVHISIPGQDNEVLLIGLDQAGIMAVAGSACSASKEETSHVLKAIGLSDEQARASLRFSLGRQTTTKDIHYTVSVLKRLVSSS